MPEDKDLLKMPQSEGENTFSQNPRWKTIGANSLGHIKTQKNI